MANHAISIGSNVIGAGQPVFVIAEAGVNHNGELSLAKRLIDAAAKAGADAVKFQTFDPDTLVTKSAVKAEYQNRNEKREGESQHAMLSRLVLRREHHAELKKHAEGKGLLFLSTPFSLSDAAFLRDLGVKALKVGSTDTNNLPYLKTIAKWKLPLILSTGMSDLEEVREAVEAIQNPSSDKNRSAPFKKGRIKKDTPLILLHCTTNYPTPFTEANVRAVETLRKAFGLPVGFSDHTVGSEAAVAAVALGACVIEKHFTLDRALPGPDHAASLEPDELADFIRSIRNVEAALGTGTKVPFPSEKETAKVARKSITAAQDIKAGERLSEKNLCIKRPGTGLAPREWDNVVGRTAKEDIDADTLLTKKMFK